MALLRTDTTCTLNMELRTDYIRRILIGPMDSTVELDDANPTVILLDQVGQTKR